MAYAAVASLTHTIDIVLNYHEDSVSPQFKDQIIALHKHTIFFESFLEDAPDRAKNWEETIREVTDRAEEIIELLLSDSLLESKSTVGSSKPKLEKGEHELDYSFDELERASEEMESIASRLKGKHAEATGGSDEELMGIISRLRGGSSELETIAIIGMGGMGKSDLARNAYNHPLIVEHFQIRAWSLISQQNSRRGIISELLRSMKAERMSISDSEEQLIQRLYKNLYGRRYLIVLNDMWSLKDWNSLKFMFPNNGNGSRIIFTTRLITLCHYVNASYIHEMRLLNYDETWNLLRQKILEGDPCPPQLESVGKIIAESCEGHPLTIAVVSGILAADQTQAAWEDFSENIKIASDAYEILLLSYTYFPHHLRPCFLYLASFPEDHEIYVSKLVRLWVAEGFLNQSEYKSYEEIGEERVEDLVRRNLVSVSKRKSNGRIKSIKIHDIMRELCLRQAGIDSFLLHVVKRYYRQINAEELGSYRRVSTFSCDNDFLEVVYGPIIRTIMLSLEDSNVSVIRWPIGNVRLLRILDLSNASNYDLPEEVFELFHLRYLAFHCEFSISEAISNLQNLQTLIICPRKNDGELFGEMPEGIWRMPQLRHLIVFYFKLPSPKGATSALENLQTLSGVVDFICSRENLKMIPILKKLAIFYSNNSGDVVEDYQLYNLIYLQKLEILEIVMNRSFVEKRKMSTRRTFQFPPTLKKLNLCGVQFAWEDMKIVASLPNLQVLKLRNHACIGKTWETSEGGFSQLTYLMIEESNLKNWITESSHFPRLKCLVLRWCFSLLEVPNDMRKITTLELIELDGENHSLLCSATQIQKDLQSSGDDRLQIHVL